MEFLDGCPSKAARVPSNDTFGWKEARLGPHSPSAYIVGDDKRQRYDGKTKSAKRQKKTTAGPPRVCYLATVSLGGGTVRVTPGYAAATFFPIARPSSASPLRRVRIPPPPPLPLLLLRCLLEAEKTTARVIPVGFGTLSRVLDLLACVVTRARYYCTYQTTEHNKYEPFGDQDIARHSDLTIKNCNVTHLGRTDHRFPLHGLRLPRQI